MGHVHDVVFGVAVVTQDMARQGATVVLLARRQNVLEGVDVCWCLWSTHS